MKFPYAMLPLSLILACQTPRETVTHSEHPEHTGYLRWVGDIPFDEEIDDPAFQLCRGDSNVLQYFHTSDDALSNYEGEKRALTLQLKAAYNPVDVKEGGWIRIRFIVNCTGETGRFRVISADDNYQVFTFDQRITAQLLTHVKALDGWKVHEHREQVNDYYQYLTFKIQNGEISEILP